jgi:hypothetical protein
MKLRQVFFYIWNGSARKTSILKEPNVEKHLSQLHDKYVVVPADKAPINIFFKVCVIV